MLIMVLILSICAISFIHKSPQWWPTPPSTHLSYFWSSCKPHGWKLLHWTQSKLPSTGSRTSTPGRCSWAGGLCWRRSAWSSWSEWSDPVCKQIYLTMNHKLPVGVIDGWLLIYYKKKIWEWFKTNNFCWFIPPIMNLWFMGISFTNALDADPWYDLTVLYHLSYKYVQRFQCIGIL